jgi:hypothetical protein
MGIQRVVIRVGMAGEIDPLGTRKDALDAFLETKVAEGFQLETHTDVHAIIVESTGARHVVQVDEDGMVSTRPAEPLRS